VPLSPGETALSLGSGFYRANGAVSMSISHRLRTATPLYLTGGYSNGGGSEHVGRGAVTFVW
jgi:hypothetical protein